LRKKTPSSRKKKQAPIQEEYKVHEIVIDPDEEMLIEGEMMKFKPGIERNFISRWIQLSTRSFRYYKNHYHSICYLTRPISAIPLNAIDKVANFSISNEEYKKREKTSYTFMFEIVLR
jgi:tRNA A37 N6-isopentenylltransferase MiaA